MKNILTTLLIFCFPAFLICSDTTNPSDKINVAVAEFEARGVSQSEAVTISEFFRTALVNTHTLSVIDRTNMDGILAEQAFQMTGCTSEECVIKMGKILNVRRMITGIVTDFAPFYYISISVINVETGEIIHSERVKAKSRDDLPDLSDKLAKIISERLSGKKPLIKTVPDREVIGIGLVDFQTMFNSNRIINSINVSAPLPYLFDMPSVVTAFTENNLGLRLKYYPINSWFISVSYCLTTIKKTVAFHLGFASPGISVNQTTAVDVEQTPIIGFELGKELQLSNLFKLFIAGSVLSSSFMVSSPYWSYGFQSYVSDDNRTSFNLSGPQTSMVDAIVYTTVVGLEYKPKERLGVSLSVNYNMSVLEDNKYALGYTYNNNNAVNQRQYVPFTIFSSQIIPWTFSLCSTLYF